MKSGADELLQVENLTVGYRTEAGRIEHALCGVSFRLRRHQCAVILGESGSGKTTLARAILRLLPAAGRVIEGRILFNAEDLMALPESRMQTVRGAGITMMLQEPALALNPVMRAIDQVSEVIRASNSYSRETVERLATQSLEAMHLTGSDKVQLAYPHQMSGGQRQRLLLAMSLAAKPDLLIADEPTSSVDDELRAQISSILQQVRHGKGPAVLWITHDPQDIVSLADRVLVLYAGELVEDAPVDDLISRPLHPYTKLLLAAAPQPAGLSRKTDKRLPVFSGPVSMSGCRFAPRCPERLPVCSEGRPAFVQLGHDRSVRCVRYAD
jgi:oligopeptide/dipeptide ABC transporter ATP-binding protein